MLCNRSLERRLRDDVLLADIRYSVCSIRIFYAGGTAMPQLSVGPLTMTGAVIQEDEIPRK